MTSCGRDDGRRRASIGVIGAGIFGVSAALELSRLNAAVTLYERRDDLLGGTSARNLFRLHRGYHYPRDPATAQQARDGYTSFVGTFGAAVTTTVSHHYAIASRRSRTSPDEFRAHCDRLGLRAQPVRMPFLSAEAIQACFEVDEAYFDVDELRKLAWEQLTSAGVRVEVGSSVRAGDIARANDCVVVTTYSSVNNVLSELGCPTMLLQYELCEVPVVRCPRLDRCSVVVMDGRFVSIAPYRGDLHLLYDVAESVHHRFVGDRRPDVAEFRAHLGGPRMTPPSTTRFDAIVTSARRFLAPLDDVAHVGSLFAERVVLPSLGRTDARPTLVRWLAPDVIAVLSGKVSVAVDAGRTVAGEVAARLDLHAPGSAPGPSAVPPTAACRSTRRSGDRREGPLCRRSVLVTGAGGFIGSRLVKMLVGRGHLVAAVDHDVTRLQRLGRLRGGNLHTFHCDITDAGGIAAAVRAANPDAVVHLAAQHLIPQCEARPAQAVAVNVTGLINTLTAADEAGPDLVVFASTADVYAPSDEPVAEDDLVQPANVYGASKFLGERLVAEWQRRPGRKATSVRIFNVYGPGDGNPHVIPEIVGGLLRREPIRLGNLEPRRDFVYVDDVVEVIGRIVETPEPPAVLNTGTGVATSIGELLTVFEDLVHDPLAWEHDRAKARPADRRHLQADASLMQALMPDLVPRGLHAGLWETLVGEGLTLGAG